MKSETSADFNKPMSQALPNLRPRHLILKKILRLIMPKSQSRLLEVKWVKALWNRVFTWTYYNYLEKGYVSENGQDIFLLNGPFRGVKNGVFVDIGAYDGVECSNTYVLEKSLGWKGVCFEPQPQIFKKLKDNRGCLCVEAAAAEKDGVAEFHVMQDPYWDKGSSLAELGVLPKHLQRSVLQVRTVDVAKFLVEKKLCKIDYLSIDTEGGELKIFLHIHGRGIHPQVVSLEKNEDFTKMDQEMESLGYEFESQVGKDRFYRLKKS